ncbi:MAG: fibronectin type III domain-containing protein [Muribaculaceae bacterium]|nr:fibronectin type III domain-containing protein [Muribaculaceae bacterium]
MEKFNYSAALTTLFVGAAFSLSAIGPTGISPEKYGTFRGKDAKPAKVTAFTSGGDAKKGPVKVLAYANDGNAEVDKIGELSLQVEEDFSKLITGSEENPDLTTILDIQQWMTDPETGAILRDEMGNPIENPEFKYPWNNMKPEYISSDNKNWGVGNAFPAGGMLYFPFSQDMPQGKISTPWIDLSANAGTFVVEFKVKVTEEAKSNPMMPAMIIVETAETNGMSPTWDMFEQTFMDYEHITTEWTTFRLVFQGAGKSTLCNIVGQGMSGGMYIDDVRMYSLDPYLDTPVVRRHSDFTESSFVLNWHPVENADKYLVNVWCYDLYGDLVTLADNAETTETSYKVEGSNLDDTYYYNVQAVNSEYKSLTSKNVELFDIVSPVMRKATLIDDKNLTYEGGVEEVLSAFGYNYSASVRRVAESDGPFIVTDEKFTDWTHPSYGFGEEYTKENPADDKIATLYFPVDINQQGWYGENFMIYKDYLCLCPFFYEASNWQEQSCWVSPEFDLSKDGGNISISMDLAAAYDINFENYASCAIALFNWNDEIGDYEQVELAYCRDLNFDWQNRSVSFTKGSKKSKIGFFGVGSFGDLYIDNILIMQKYKEGEYFDDPFFFSTWQLAEQTLDPTSFEFDVPERAIGKDIYQRAQAVRMHTDVQGNYDGEAVSEYSGYDYVGNTSGVRLVENGAKGVRVDNGMILISNAAGENVTVSTASGISHDLGTGSEISFRPESRGVYVVTIGGKSVKIVM